MLNHIKNHPFAVEAFFEESLVLTFALPKEQLQPFLPPCLSLDVFKEQWAFLAVAMVQTIDLRPKGFPKFFGSDFFLIGYRIFVRYNNVNGKRLRGLYILKSETNRMHMELMGNIFTHYHYKTVDISRKTQGNLLEIASKQSNFKVQFDIQNIEPTLPKDSPFTDWSEARKFAGPLPFTFSYHHQKKEVLIIEGVRQHWIPQPIEVQDYYFSFLAHLQLQNPVLANAFVIRNIPYYWKKGKIEKWKQENHFKG
jgi:hypothetical protein